MSSVQTEKIAGSIQTSYVRSGKICRSSLKTCFVHKADLKKTVTDIKKFVKEQTKDGDPKNASIDVYDATGDTRTEEIPCCIRVMKETLIKFQLCGTR